MEAQEQEKQLAESAAVALEGEKVKKARRRKKKGAANSTPEGQNAKQSYQPISQSPRSLGIATILLVDIEDLQNGNVCTF
jgi:hypothetical protein